MVDKPIIISALSTWRMAMIHDRIRRARVLKGYTLEPLAHTIGDITIPALSKFQNGQTAPNSTRLLQLAKALELSPEYFFRADVVELAPLEFRKLAKMPKYRQEQVTERIREHLERYIALESCFEHADVDTPVTPQGIIAVSSFDEAEAAAK